MIKNKKARVRLSILTLMFASTLFGLFSIWQSKKMSALLMEDNVEAIASGDRFSHDYQICYPTTLSISQYDHYKCHKDTDLHFDYEIYGLARAGLLLWSFFHQRPKEGTYQCPQSKVPCQILGDYGFCWKNY